MYSDVSHQVWGAGGGSISAGRLRPTHLFLGNNIGNPVSTSSHSVGFYTVDPRALDFLCIIEPSFSKNAEGLEMSAIAQTN